MNKYAGVGHMADDPSARMWDQNGVPVGAKNADGSPYTQVDPNGPGAIGSKKTGGRAFGGGDSSGDMTPRPARRLSNTIPADTDTRIGKQNWSGPGETLEPRDGTLDVDGVTRIRTGNRLAEGSRGGVTWRAPDGSDHGVANPSPGEMYPKTTREQWDQRHQSPPSRNNMGHAEGGPQGGEGQQGGGQGGGMGVDPMSSLRKYAGPSGMGAGTTGKRFGARYLQARLHGMSKATVSPRVNQMKTMNSPEWAAAKAMGISVPYSSGGESMVDVTSAENEVNNTSPLASPSGKRDAQKRLDRFDQMQSDTGAGEAMEGAELSRDFPGSRRAPARRLRSGSELPTDDGSSAINSEYDGGETRSPGIRGGGNERGVPLTPAEARGRDDRYTPIGQRRQ